LKKNKEKENEHKDFNKEILKLWQAIIVYFLLGSSFVFTFITAYYGKTYLIVAAIITLLTSNALAMKWDYQNRLNKQDKEGEEDGD
jgi:hypothetical protein